MMPPVEMQRKLEQVFTERQAGVLTEVIATAHNDLVRAGDFNELKTIVRDLAAAQQRTEQRVAELTTAQQRTEQRMAELATAQQRTEQRVEELTVAQHDLATMQRQMAESLQGLTIVVQGLTTAQERTERSLQQLSRQVGGISDRLGGDLEDVAYSVVHDVLQREFGWQVDPLARSWQYWNGSEEEVDLFGQALDPAQPDVPIYIVGEVKFNLTRRDVERFAKKVERARKYLSGKVFPICFCYRARPEAQRAVQEAGFHLIFSHGRIV